MIGKTISHYKILEELGRGGMGVVYKAEDTKLKRTVALKFLREQAIAEEDERTRFLHEAQAAAALNHPNICTIHEINKVEGHTFIAMEFIEGENLRERARSRPLLLAEALDIAVQAASGLRAAHDKGIVHRDIKSANIMVTPDGQVKITDFGLAKTSGATRVTRTGTTLGTAAYMSPEQALGKAIDRRTDIWSLGVVLYEILMGELPFKGDYDPALMYAIVNEEPEPVTDRKPDVPLEVEQVITRALAKDPDKRYQSANELMEALEELRESLHLLPKRSRLQLRIMRQRRRIAWIASLGVIGIIAGFMIYHYAIVPRRELAEQALEISPNVIAVLPFSVRGGQGTDYLDEAMVDLLSTKLSGVGELRCVDQHALLSYVNRLGTDPLDVESGRAVAEHFGAGLYVLGSVLVVGSNFNISARLYDPAGGTEVVAKEVEGKTDELIALVNRLAVQLLADRIDERGESTQRLYELSSSFPAIKEYLQGETLYRIGKFGEAVDAYQNAIREDTLFSLAYLRLGQAASFSPSKGTRVAAQGLKMANELKERLPERERLLIEAYHTAFIEVNAKDGLPLLRNIVQRYPDYIEGWFWLGDIEFPYGRRHNIGLDEARYSFKRTLSLDPDFLPAAMMMYWLSGIEEKPEECTAWAKRRLELAPEGEYSLYIRAVLAFVEGDAEEQEKVLEELEIASDKILFWAAGDLATFYGDFDGSKAVWHLIIESSRPPETRAYALTSLAYQELSRGKRIEADAYLARAEKLDAFQSVTTRAILSLLPFMQRSNEELEELRNAVARLDLETKNDTIQCAYVLGLLNARLGDYEAALEAASRLEDFWHTYRNRGQVYGWYRFASVSGYNMARCIRGEVARLRGNTEEALAEAENILPDLWRDILPGDIIWSNAYGRFLRATLLEELGRSDQALRWYGSLGLPEALEIVYWAPKHRQMGEIYERMGESEKAVRHYSRFVELYADCDEGFRPLIADTEQKLAELRK